MKIKGAILFAVVVGFVGSLEISGVANAREVLPEWINKPAAFCNKGEICAVGEGGTLLSSFSNARNEIAKQFNVSVKGNFNSTIEQKGNSAEESVSSYIDETTDDILNGVFIKEDYIDMNGNHYAYAVLDKSKVENDIKFDIDSVDTQMQIAIEQKPVHFTALKTMYKQREDLNKRYLFLTGKKIPEKVSLDEIYAAKGEPLTYKLMITDEEFNLGTVLTEQIIENRDKLAGENDEKYDRKIVGNALIEKGYLNVKGFEKYLVSVSLMCLKGSNTVGQLNVELYETGRDKKQAIEKMKARVVEYVKSNIDSLLV
ncbi:MAG: LPP20 family lipoprotein [Rickettsiales bacterium]|nr:LPP20 family lipoprotein [Rickettsiales bacterium]